PGETLRAVGAARHRQRDEEGRRAEVTDEAIAELAPLVGVKAACEALGQPRALSATERAEVLEVLHSEEHVDEAPATVYAKLLDRGVYLCSVPTMYRVLRGENEVRERRRQATHPPAKRPELVAV